MWGYERTKSKSKASTGYDFGDVLYGRLMIDMVVASVIPLVLGLSSFVFIIWKCDP